MKFKLLAICLTVSFCFSILTISCSSEPDVINYTEETIDGVRYVHNQFIKSGGYGNFSLEFVQRFGDLDSEDENYLLFSPTDVAIDSKGNVLIADKGNCRIQTYNKNGKYVSTLGSKGQGPYEFLEPNQIVIDREDNLYVTDNSLGRIKAFSPTGELKKMTPKNYLYSGFVVTKNLDFYKPDNNDGDETLIEKFKLDSEESEYFVPADNIGEMWRDLYMNIISFDIDLDGNIYVAYPYKNKLEKYTSEGSLTYVTDRKIDYEIPGEYKQVDRVIGGQIFKSLDWNTITSDVSLDTENRLWALTYKRPYKDEERIMITTQSVSEGGNTTKTSNVYSNGEFLDTDLFEFHIFNNNGVMADKIQLTHYSDSFKIFNDRLFIVDTYRNMCVYEYKIKVGN